MFKQGNIITQTTAKNNQGKEIVRVSYRSKTNGADAAIFRRTAVKTKKINVSPKLMRGGIRL